MQFSLMILLSMFLPEDEADMIEIVAAILLQRPQNIFIAIVVAD